MSVPNAKSSRTGTAPEPPKPPSNVASSSNTLGFGSPTYGYGGLYGGAMGMSPYGSAGYSSLGGYGSYNSYGPSFSSGFGSYGLGLGAPGFGMDPEMERCVRVHWSVPSCSAHR
jgi:hypothetical protein